MLHVCKDEYITVIDPKEIVAWQQVVCDGDNTMAVHLRSGQTLQLDYGLNIGDMEADQLELNRIIGDRR